MFVMRQLGGPFQHGCLKMHSLTVSCNAPDLLYAGIAVKSTG